MAASNVPVISRMYSTAVREKLIAFWGTLVGVDVDVVVAEELDDVVVGVGVDVDSGGVVSSTAAAVVWVPVDDSSEEGEELSKTMPFIVATEARAASVRL